VSVISIPKTPSAALAVSVSMAMSDHEGDKRLRDPA
jgi:hypothetical protein